MGEEDHYQVISKRKLTRLHEGEHAHFVSRTKASATLLERGKKSMIKGVPMPWMFGLYRHPSLFVESGAGPVFRDVDGNSYIDFNVVDLAMTMGFSNPHINAAVITEPALSNCTLVKPEAGYLEGLYQLAQRHGSLLCLDEAHNFSFAYGGLKRAWDLPCDFLVLGKGLGTGVPFGLYGMSEDVAGFVDAHTAIDLGEPGIAAGGTTYANTLAVFAAQAALEKVLTPAAYQRLEQLGTHLAKGLQRVFDDLELPWKALHLGPRSGYCMNPAEPRNGAEAYASIDVELIAARKLFMANRGIWDAMPTAGPQVSFVHDEAEVELYLGLAREFLQLIRK